MATMILPATELRERIGPILQRIVETDEPVFITKHGRAQAVLVSIARYDELVAAQAVAQSTIEAPASTEVQRATIARYEGLLSRIDFSERGHPEERSQHSLRVNAELAETRRRANSKMVDSDYEHE